MIHVVVVVARYWGGGGEAKRGRDTPKSKTAAVLFSNHLVRVCERICWRPCGRPRWCSFGIFPWSIDIPHLPHRYESGRPRPRHHKERTNTWSDPANDEYPKFLETKGSIVVVVVVVVAPELGWVFRGTDNERPHKQPGLQL
jgi:hypothetical protein